VAFRVANLGRVSAETSVTDSPPGLSVREVYTNGYPTSYGNVISVGGAGHNQLLLGWAGTSGAVADNFIRSQRDTSDAEWSAWAKIVTDANFNSYAPSLTGAGASGSWAINITGSASGNVAKGGDVMSGFLTLHAQPTNALHAATKNYVDAVAGQNAYRFTYGWSYSQAGYTNQVGSWNDARNYFDIYPPSGYTMSSLVGFIPSIAIIHYAGGVDGNDSLRCYPVYFSDRIRVYVQNTEQRSTPAANWLAIWR
jgi:hypothetical protein